MKYYNAPFAIFFGILAALFSSCQPSTPPSAPSSEEASQGQAAVVHTENNDASATGSGDVTPLQIIIPANDLQVGTPRIPFILMDGSTQVATVQSIDLIGFDLATNPPTEIWRGSAQNFSDYLIPYWVITPEITEPGNYGFRATMQLEGGSTNSSNFAVALAEKSEAPAVGDLGVASQNRTSGDGFELNELSSDPNPEPAFYTNTISIVSSNGRPTVIAFNTPAYCQTAICAPVLNSIKEVHAAYGGEVDFVHIEIYKSFDPLIVDDTVTEWNLQSEPWTYVLNGSGQIEARLAGPVSGSELTQLLEDLLDS